MSVLNQFLHGVKIVDLSQYLPGPIASLMLSDMGAKVVKIVPPGGDGLQHVGPRDKAGRPIFYGAFNEGKYEVQLDLKKESDRAILLDLIAKSDVLIEGFRPGTLSRLGFSAATLKGINAGLILCAISSYGADGPLAGAAAHDANLLASGGILSRNDGSMFDPPIVDGTAALFAALSITAALYYRDRNDHSGCTIDIGLSDVMMPLQLGHIAAYAKTGWLPDRRSYYLNGGLACYNRYRTVDNQGVILGALEEKFWKAFCATAQKPQWIARHGDVEPQTELIREVTEFFGSLTLQNVRDVFREVDCCLTPIVNLGEALNDPQTRHRDLIRSHGSTLQVLYPARVDGEAPNTRHELQQLTPQEARQVFA